MKASPSSASEEDEAENKNGEIVFDYCDFFSVLMYYGNMSKSEIMRHSRAFLHGIYRMYVKRACENLGVSSDKKDDETDEAEDVASKYNLRADDYPTEFTKLPPRPDKKVERSPDEMKKFMASFGAGAEVFKNVQIIKDE